MRSIHAAGRNVAYRLRSLQKTPRPSFSPCTGRPVVSLHASQIRAQHDAARSQAPPLPWRPQPDLQQPLPLEKELQPPPQYTTLHTAKNLVGPAQDVPEQNSQTPTAGASAVARADTTVGVSDASESSLPFVCKECGSMFQTQHGLEDHLACKAQQSLSGQAASCRDSISVAGMKANPHVLEIQNPRDLRFTVGLGEKVFEIPSRELEPSSVAISQDSGHQVVSSFNIKPGATSPISVPGFPPLWKDPKLPIHLHSRSPRKAHPQGQILKAIDLLMFSAHTTSSEFRNDQVDVVTHVQLLATLFKFCKGQNPRTFRFILRMVKGSLFLAHDPTLPPTGLIGYETLRYTLKKYCTEMPPGLEHSNHHRSVQYSLGNIKCVVQSQIDALCSTLPHELQPSSSPNPVGLAGSQQHYPQTDAAMTQVRHKGKKPSGLPYEAFWLSRIPFILRGTLSDGVNLTNVSKVDAYAEGREWEKEEKHQVALRKLATLLSELKKGVEAAAPDGQACHGLIDRHLDTPTIQVFLSEEKPGVGTEAISSSISWAGETSHGPDEASEDGHHGPASEAEALQDKTLSENHDEVSQQSVLVQTSEGLDPISPDSSRPEEEEMQRRDTKPE